jgi:DNA-binding MarR family transcriptional regulator
VRVVLTDSGRRTVDDALSDLLAREHALLEALPPDRQAELADLLRGLVRSFDT